MALASRIHAEKITIVATPAFPDQPSSGLGTVTISGDRKDAAGAAFVLTDGRVDVKLTNRASKLSQRLQTRAIKNLHFPLGEHLTRNNKDDKIEFRSILGRFSGSPRLNIAIHIVGSRGDVQPFIAIGQVLQKPPYSHRVRICTHAVFKDFVQENGLEFFSIGGDPATLMAYMVKNPGLMPGRESWKAGDVGKRRADIAQILQGTWRSCIEPGDGMGGETRDARGYIDAEKLFVADAIIANPPSYGHIHCAEKLGIPLHMMFTMPWSPTQYFPHPLASMERNYSDPNLANYISYSLMELLAWQGLGDVINEFRMHTLNLDPISPLWGHMLLARMKVPFTYAWSSALIPKPPDWGSHINISGFAFLSAPSTYKPPEDLMEFLNAGPPPVYIGFGSIVVDDPNKLTAMIFGAVNRAGVRALVSKGWGGLGGEDPPEGIFLLGNCPHDWLFKYVSAVVHHGGAGTTAIGIAMGKPTVVVPFFGDQPFWGAMIYRSGAGPEPVPYKKLTEEILAEKITKALGPEIQTAVKEMSKKIANERGAVDAAASFHQAVNMDSMRCLLCPDEVAVWRLKKTNIRLSCLAAATLIDNGFFTLSDTKLVKHRDWYIDEGASNPLFGAIAAISGTLTNSIVTVNKYTKEVHQTVHKKPEEHTSPASTPDEEPFEWDLYKIPSRNPVMHAIQYPPQHLEMVAHRMASKTLPTYKDRVKWKKKHALSSAIANTPTTKSTASKTSKHEHSKLYEASAETGQMTLSLLSTGFKAPVAFFYQLANGFHNAPSFIFHDETVRKRDKITGLGSGIIVAAKGFAFNLLDGVTGLVYHPYLGAQKEGPKGFAKGIGKGVGGLVFKTTAAVVGLPAYSLKGLEKQIEKRHERTLKAQILEVRLRQAMVAFERATQEEKDAILARWNEMGGASRLASARGRAVGGPQKD